MKLKLNSLLGLSATGAFFLCAFSLNEGLAGKVKSRSPSQETGYKCRATEWPFTDTPAGFQQSVSIFKKMKRQGLYEYFLHELTHIDLNQPNHLKLARDLGGYLRGSEPSEFYRGFIDLAIHAADLESKNPHPLPIEELCEIMKRFTPSSDRPER